MQLDGPVAHAAYFLSNTLYADDVYGFTILRQGRSEVSKWIHPWLWSNWLPFLVQDTKGLWMRGGRIDPRAK